MMPKEIETAVMLLNSAQRNLALIRDNVEAKLRLEKAIHDALVFLKSTKCEIVPVALKELEDALGDKQIEIINCLKDEGLREAWQATYIAAHHHRKRMLYEETGDWNRMKEILSKSWRYPKGDRKAANQAEAERRAAMKEAVAICERNLALVRAQGGDAGGKA